MVVSIIDSRKETLKAGAYWSNLLQSITRGGDRILSVVADFRRNAFLLAIPDLPPITPKSE